MNKKLIKASVAGAAAIALAAGGTTFASWSDFAQVDDNSAGAGILRLDLTGGNTDSASIGWDNVRMKPGGTEERVMYIASNDGDSVPKGKLKMTISDLLETEANGFKADKVTPGTGLSDGSLCTTLSEKVAEGGSCGTPGEFLKEGIVTVRYSTPGVLPAGVDPEACDNALSFPDDASTFYRLWDGEDKSPLNNKQFDMGTVAPGEGVCAIIEIVFPASASNASQGDTASFDMRFDLNQA